MKSISPLTCVEVQDAYSCIYVLWQGKRFVAGQNTTFLLTDF